MSATRTVFVIVLVLFMFLDVEETQSQEFDVLDYLQNDTTRSMDEKSWYVSFGRKFENVDRFSDVEVILQSDSATGLSKDKLSDYAKLRFKNNFAGYKLGGEWLNKPFDEYTEEDWKITASHITFKVWTVGTDYPIAYHVSINCSALKPFNRDHEFPRAYERAYLGYASSETIEDRIKECIDSMLEEFAIEFFKARGDI